MNIDAISVDVLAHSYGFAERKGDEEEVDTDALRKSLAQGFPSTALVYGHLLPYVFKRKSVTRIVVLRCEPAVLKMRLATRGYSQAKVLANIEGELIGSVASEAVRSFGRGKVSEVDTTYSEPMEVAKSAATFLGGLNHPSSRIDWTPNYDSGSKLRSLLS